MKTLIGTRIFADFHGFFAVLQNKSVCAEGAPLASASQKENCRVASCILEDNYYTVGEISLNKGDSQISDGVRGRRGHLGYLIFLAEYLKPQVIRIQDPRGVPHSTVTPDHCWLGRYCNHGFHRFTRIIFCAISVICGSRIIRFGECVLEMWNQN